MFKQISIILMIFFITACASTGPETQAPTATAPSASADTVAADDSAASPPEEMPQTASVESDYDPDELVCRRERETGSNFYRRICRTRAEIEAREAQDQEILRTGRKIQTGSSCALNGDC